MVKQLTQGLNEYQWALPEKLGVPPDELTCRLDFYNDSILLYMLDKKAITTKQVSADDIVMALLSQVDLATGLLPDDTLWWNNGKNGLRVGLWRRPQVWKVALALKALQPPERFTLPMPGLIFVCSPGRTPTIFAAKKKPKSPKEHIYHAPLFNIFGNGNACSGTHKYPAKVSDIPESFFLSFFTMEANYSGRSKSHPDSLLALWKELDGKKKFPLGDLVKAGTLEDIMK